MQVQDLGLASRYMSDDSVRHYIGMLDGLAFLPIPDIPAGIQYLRGNVPNVSGIDELIEYFDPTYISGQLRSSTSQGRGQGRPVLRLRRSPPLFPPALWNVHDSTVTGQERTNNVCEGWNNAFSSLVGQSHPSIWVLIHELQLDQVIAATDLMQNARGQPPAKRIKRAIRINTRSVSLTCAAIAATVEKLLNKLFMV